MNARWKAGRSCVRLLKSNDLLELMTPSRKHALTIDVEDYFHVAAFAQVVRREAWDSFPSRVVRNTEALLELLAERQTLATFFVLGWVAERFPQLVRRIVDAGHEVGSHSYWHDRIQHQSPAEFRDDLRRSKQVLEEIVNESITMYRAPTFSITEKTLWALDILVEEGFTLDASIFPIRHDRYGIPTAPTQLHRRNTSAGSIWEFPPTVTQIGGYRLPMAGGGYFRIFPWGMTRWGLRRAERSTDAPMMFYLHPWEIDPKQPKIGGISKLSQWRHRANLHRTADRLTLLLKTFRFGRISDVLPQIAEQARREDNALTAEAMLP